MNDSEFIKYMKETAQMLHELRLEVAMLRELRLEVAMLRELRLEVAMLREVVRGKAISNRFLTMDEACEYLHISRTTMTKRLADGEIAFASKKGKSWLFPEEQLKAYASGMA